MALHALVFAALGLALTPAPSAHGAAAAARRCPSPALFAAKRPAKGAKRLSAKPPPVEIAKEKHLHFDEAEVAVRAGAGGNGAVVSLSDGVKLRRTADNDYELPPGGGHGGDVTLFVDASLCDLLHLRGRPALVGERGGDSLGVRDLPQARQLWRELADADADGGDAPPTLAGVRLRDGEHLRVPVPPGTFVRTKNGRVLGDLVAAGQELVVARGGDGGPCLLREQDELSGAQGAKGSGKKRRGRRSSEEEDGTDERSANALRLSDEGLWKLTLGRPAEEVRLSLVLRTVADVGFVGFPNAGKSTLLSQLSRAAPEIAPFPFTTLMPNLGAMTSGIGADKADELRLNGAATQPTVLADLPGLVEGAHQGRGLGRLFLRHLRRVRVVLYVIDASAGADASAGEQYAALRRELKLYNPKYLARPHVVALNKLDLVREASGGGGGGGADAAAADEAFELARRAVAREIGAVARDAAEETAPPVGVVPVSGLRGKGLRILKAAIDKAVAAADEQAAAEPEQGASPQAPRPLV